MTLNWRNSWLLNTNSLCRYHRKCVHSGAGNMYSDVRMWRGDTNKRYNISNPICKVQNIIFIDIFPIFLMPWYTLFVTTDIWDRSLVSFFSDNDRVECLRSWHRRKERFWRDTYVLICLRIQSLLIHFTFSSMTECSFRLASFSSHSTTDLLSFHK